MGEIEEPFFKNAEVGLVAIEDQGCVTDKGLHGRPMFLAHRAGLEMAVGGELHWHFAKGIKMAVEGGKWNKYFKRFFGNTQGRIFPKGNENVQDP